MAKRIVSAIFMLLCALSALAEPIDSSAKAMILMEYETGRVLYEKNADALLPIASTTKIMTCLLALENCSFGESVTAGKNASGVPGTSIYLSEGETLTMEQMLYALMLRSGNDAAVAIAEHISGSEEAFCILMNARAQEIGAHAYFTTANGLDKNGNGASARGITLIAREAMKNEEFRRIVSTIKTTIPWVDHEYKRVLTNKNRLLTTYPGAVGIKTGFTSKAGRCLVFAAERDGMLVLGAVLSCGDWFDEAERIMDLGFLEYRMITPLEKGKKVSEKYVSSSAGQKIGIILSGDLSAPIKSGETYEVRYEIENLTPPIQMGEAVGIAYLSVNGTDIASQMLVSDRTVQEMTFERAFKDVWLHWPSA